jgi:class 3 adenylate cyclase
LTVPANDLDRLRAELEVVARFPDQNPHPVMRIGGSGELLYANTASRGLLDELGLRLKAGDPLPASLVQQLAEAAATGDAVELLVGMRAYAVLAVHVPELGFTNVYGTDITPRKVIERFPERNPFPVMRLTSEGVLTYANAASAGIVSALGLQVGEPFPAELLERMQRALEAGDRAPVEVSGDGRTFALHCVPVPEANFTNVYGADVTAQKAMTKFPDQNPHPVLRIDANGVLLYANPAADPVVRALGVNVGQPLPGDLAARLGTMADAGAGDRLEIEAEDRLFSLIAVKVYEFGFTNVYGTDITAAREVERAHAENERLLLNILPESIANRLRSGEMLIADRVEEMTVLFADVVNFSGLSQQLSPGDLVSLLNEVFSIFDMLAEHYDLEKIKTIGDAYMVVGGLAPNPQNHCGRVADLALDMLTAIGAYREESGIDLHIRVGMHMGPAVAGVVGIKKFIYDVWGETVNTASRMESHGQPDRVQVSEVTYERLRDRYRLSARGMVDVRGRGPMPTWFLEERVAPVAAAPS